jgi:polysaccharide export outer membrane protein
MRFFSIKPNFHVFMPLAAALLLMVSAWNGAMSQERVYRVGPRDILSLTVFAGGEKQQDLDLQVSQSGMINVPLAGNIQAAGKTLGEIENLIHAPLARDYYVNPQVFVRVKEYHSLQYYISGAVDSPGLYEMAYEASLMELIAKAGGVVQGRGNVAYVLRGSTDQIAAGQDAEELLAKKEPIRVDLKALLDKGDMSHNLKLSSGDVVYIPLEKALKQSETKIYVEGNVKTPGVYDYQPGLTALEACIMAGGFDGYAAPGRATVNRQKKDAPDGREIIRVNLDDVKKGKTPDIELQPGDRIHVPETWF